MRSRPSLTRSKLATSPDLKSPALQQLRRRHGRGARDGHLSQGVALAFIHGDEDMQALDIRGGLGADLGPGHAQAAAGFVDRADGGVEQLAETRFGEERADPHTRDGRAQHGLRHHLVAFEGDLGHGGAVARGAYEDRELVRGGGHHARRDLLGACLWQPGTPRSSSRSDRARAWWPVWRPSRRAGLWRAARPRDRNWERPALRTRPGRPAAPRRSGSWRRNRSLSGPGSNL